jgi:hypothetical protein
MQADIPSTEESLGTKCQRVVGICFLMATIIFFVALAVDKVVQADAAPVQSIALLSRGTFMLTAPLLVSIVFVGVSQCLRLRAQRANSQE